MRLRRRGRRLVLVHVRCLVLRPLMLVLLSLRHGALVVMHVMRRNLSRTSRMTLLLLDLLLLRVLLLLLLLAVSMLLAAVVVGLLPLLHGMSLWQLLLLLLALLLGWHGRRGLGEILGVAGFAPALGAGPCGLLS